MSLRRPIKRKRERTMRIVIGLALLAALTTTTATKADPCRAIPDRGPMPSYLHRGAQFSGPV
ncbi:nuclease, partial [Klebsiella pneumoniae]|nr:nuclease [Klebsiella pneumoniae]